MEELKKEKRAIRIFGQKGVSERILSIVASGNVSLETEKGF